VEAGIRIKAAQNNHGHLDIELTDRHGNRPVQIRFDADGWIKANEGHAISSMMAYEPNTWYTFSWSVEASPYGTYTLSIDDQVVLEHAALAGEVKSLERISIRTGLYRDTPNRLTDNEAKHSPLPGSDHPVENAIYFIDDFWASGHTLKQNGEKR